MELWSARVAYDLPAPGMPRVNYFAVVSALEGTSTWHQVAACMLITGTATLECGCNLNRTAWCSKTP